MWCRLMTDKVHETTKDSAVVVFLFTFIYKHFGCSLQSLFHYIVLKQSGTRLCDNDILSEITRDTRQKQTYLIVNIKRVCIKYACACFRLSCYIFTYVYFDNILCEIGTSINILQEVQSTIRVLKNSITCGYKKQN